MAATSPPPAGGFAVGDEVGSAGVGGGADSLGTAVDDSFGDGVDEGDDERVGEAVRDGVSEEERVGSDSVDPAGSCAVGAGSGRSNAQASTSPIRRATPTRTGTS